MGQKVNPIGLRLGINRTWDSRWYATRSEYGQLLAPRRWTAVSVLPPMARATGSR